MISSYRIMVYLLLLSSYSPNSRIVSTSIHEFRHHGAIPSSTTRRATQTVESRMVRIWSDQRVGLHPRDLFLPLSSNNQFFNIIFVFPGSVSEILQDLLETESLVLILSFASINICSGINPISVTYNVQKAIFEASKKINSYLQKITLIQAVIFK